MTFLPHSLTSHSDASVLSEASPDLAAVRESRRANKDQARSLATQIARDLFAQVSSSTAATSCSLKLWSVRRLSGESIVDKYLTTSWTHVHAVMKLCAFCNQLHSSSQLMGLPISTACLDGVAP